MRSVDDHRDYLLSMVTELPPFRQQLLDVIDLSICEDVVATLSLPGFDNSAMDGYAVRAADVNGPVTDEPVVLPVVGEVAAGWAPSHPLAPGTAMKIMTGAPVPEGADAIVPYENTDRGAVDVTIRALSEYGQHIRRAGEDIAAGTSSITSGDQLGPRDIGLLAAMGMDAVMVRPRPRVVSSPRVRSSPNRAICASPSTRSTTRTPSCSPPPAGPPEPRSTGSAGSVTIPSRSRK